MNWKKHFSGLYAIHLELTNRCNKKCWMCGRRKLDKEYPDITIHYGDFIFNLLKKISKQLPPNVVVAFHNNGEPLLYPKFKEAVQLFKRQIRCMDTNGKLIVKRAKDIIDNLDTMTISVIQNDPKNIEKAQKESDEQYRLVKQFLKIRKNRKPRLIFRCLGNVDLRRWQQLDGMIATRALHAPEGCFGYERKPVIPETGICLEILNHMAINREGDVSMCVRLDPLRLR